MSPVDAQYKALGVKTYVYMSQELACLWWLAYCEYLGEPNCIHVTNAAREYYFNPVNYG